MADPENDRNLDSLLEQMLSAYSAAEPRPGFETRILANLRGRHREHTWRTVWLWAGAGAAAVAAMVLVVFFARSGERPHPPTVAQGQHEQRTVAPNTPAAPARRVIQSAAAKGARDKKRPAPSAVAAAKWPAVFPTPVALSEQEKLMFAYLENTPKEEVIAQIQSDDQKAADEFWEDRGPYPPRSQRSGKTQ